MLFGEASRFILAKSKALSSRICNNHSMSKVGGIVGGIPVVADVLIE